MVEDCSYRWRLTSARCRRGVGLESKKEEEVAMTGILDRERIEAGVRYCVESKKREKPSALFGPDFYQCEWSSWAGLLHAKDETDRKFGATCRDKDAVAGGVCDTVASG
ncbi:hypothetical protein M5K25_024972 [Dendrobium thyrsiflorum]|uniref:Uncharacterized protein n=1 Tax=Dendrobium thyrsiflorum TaxID=117978 RepID=A0ABD0U3H6_DENTH